MNFMYQVMTNGIEGCHLGGKGASGFTSNPADLIDVVRIHDFLIKKEHLEQAINDGQLEITYQKTNAERIALKNTRDVTIKVIKEYEVAIKNIKISAIRKILPDKKPTLTNFDKHYNEVSWATHNKIAHLEHKRDELGKPLTIIKIDKVMHYHVSAKAKTVYTQMHRDFMMLKYTQEASNV